MIFHGFESMFYYHHIHYNLTSHEYDYKISL